MLCLRSLLGCAGAFLASGCVAVLVVQVKDLVLGARRCWAAYEPCGLRSGQRAECDNADGAPPAPMLHPRGHFVCYQREAWDSLAMA